MRQMRIEETNIVPSAIWHHQSVLDLNDFTTEEIELVFDTADAMEEVLTREIKKVPTLRGKTIATLFYEPSTRTRLSFEIAGKSLGADISHITASTSSITKGETLIDTVRTLQATGVELIVVRHSQSGAPNLICNNLDLKVINAGDGWHAHPTQALLDMFTIKKHKGSLKGLKVAIIGDLLHSRVARSNIWGLSLMGANVFLCAPPTLMPAAWWNASNLKHSAAMPVFTVSSMVEDAIDQADVVMSLRLQLERQQTGLLPSTREYIRMYQLNKERLSLARKEAIIMHPGPVNEGVEISSELAHSTNSVIEEQVSNGVAIRMALLYLLLAGKGKS